MTPRATVATDPNSQRPAATVAGATQGEVQLPLGTTVIDSPENLPQKTGDSDSSEWRFEIAAAGPTAAAPSRKLLLAAPTPVCLARWSQAVSRAVGKVNLNAEGGLDQPQPFTAAPAETTR